MLAHEAHLVKARLEWEGIPCLLLDEYTVTMDWLYANAVGGIKLLVPQNYYDEAMFILTGDYSDELDNLTEQEGEFSHGYEDDNEEISTGPTGEEVCPYCRSHDIEITAQTPKKSWFSRLTFGFIPPPVQNSYLCHICLNEWEEK